MGTKLDFEGYMFCVTNDVLISILLLTGYTFMLLFPQCIWLLSRARPSIMDCGDLLRYIRLSE